MYELLLKLRGGIPLHTQPLLSGEITEDWLHFISNIRLEGFTYPSIADNWKFRNSQSFCNVCMCYGAVAKRCHCKCWRKGTESPLCNQSFIEAVDHEDLEISSWMDKLPRDV